MGRDFRYRINDGELEWLSDKLPSGISIGRHNRYIDGDVYNSDTILEKIEDLEIELEEEEDFDEKKYIKDSINAFRCAATLISGDDEIYIEYS